MHRCICVSPKITGKSLNYEAVQEFTIEQVTHRNFRTKVSTMQVTSHDRNTEKCQECNCYNHSLSVFFHKSTKKCFCYNCKEVVNHRSKICPKSKFIRIPKIKETIIVEIQNKFNFIKKIVCNKISWNILVNAEFFCLYYG